MIRTFRIWLPQGHSRPFMVAATPAVGLATLQHQPEPEQVVNRPPGLHLDHASERTGWKSVASVMVGYGDTAAVGMDVLAVTAALASELKAVCGQGGAEAPCGERAQRTVVAHPTVTATAGSSEMVTSGGSGTPSSIRPSITIWVTSWMLRSASSLVWPQVAAPCASSAGT